MYTFQVIFDRYEQPIWKRTHWGMSNGWGGSFRRMRAYTVEVAGEVLPAMRQIAEQGKPAVMRYYPAA